MTLGQRLKQARIEAGLSQRQLCGNTITRNMLSQIENGYARPSMDTLRYLAENLGKPMSYFLEETVVLSSNQQRMLEARTAYANGDATRVLMILEGYQAPDALFDQERGLLERLCYMELARQAILQQRLPYARTLLQKAEAASTIYAVEEQRRQFFLYKAGGTAALPNMDDMLLTMAEAAMAQNNHNRAKALLQAVEEQNAPWKRLMGLCCFAQGNYTDAAQWLTAVETVYPVELLPMLEICYRELGDYKQAYAYACKQR